jgi:hypothetical protein
VKLAEADEDEQLVTDGTPATGDQQTVSQKCVACEAVLSGVNEESLQKMKAEQLFEEQENEAPERALEQVREVLDS